MIEPPRTHTARTISGGTARVNAAGSGAAGARRQRYAPVVIEELPTKRGPTSGSHIELVVYHLFDSPDFGQCWLDRNGLDVTLPDETRSTAFQVFNLDREYNRLSEAVG